MQHSHAAEDTRLLLVGEGEVWASYVIFDHPDPACEQLQICPWWGCGRCGARLMVPRTVVSFMAYPICSAKGPLANEGWPYPLMADNPGASKWTTRSQPSTR